MPARRFLLPAFAAVVATLATRSAGAEGGRTTALHWERRAGAEDCLGPRELTDAVDQWLGREVFVARDDADVVIDGYVEPRPGKQGWRAVLSVVDARGVSQGTRELQSAQPSCRALDDAVTLSVVVTVDPDAALRPKPERPAPTPVAPPPLVARPTPAPSPPAPPPPARVPWFGGAQAGAALEAGILPHVAFGPLVRGEFGRQGGWSLDAVAGWFAPVSASGQDAGVATRFSLAYASLALCPLELVPTPRVRASACAGALVGSLDASAKGLEAANDARRLASDLEAGGRALIELAHPLVLSARLGVGLPLRRERFDYTSDAGRREVFQMSPVTVGGDVGLGVVFR